MCKAGVDLCLLYNIYSDFKTALGPSYSFGREGWASLKPGVGTELLVRTRGVGFPHLVITCVSARHELPDDL